MRKIIYLEIKKILSRPISKVAIFALLMISVFFYISEVDPWGERRSVVSNEGEVITGVEAIKYDRLQSEKYEGKINYSKIVSIYQEYNLSKDKFMEVVRKNSNNWEYVSVYNDVEPFFGNKNLLSEGGENIDTVITDYDDFRIGYTRIWGSTLSSIQHSQVFACIVMIILLAPLFSEEYNTGMVELLLVSAEGKRNPGLALGKIFAGMIISSITSVSIFFMNFLMSLVLGSYSGLFCSFQTTYPYYFRELSQRMDMWEALGMSLIFGMISIYLTSFLVMTVSAYNRNAFNTFVKSLTLYVIPALLQNSSGLTIIAILAPIIQTDLTSLLYAGSVSINGNDIFLAWGIVPVVLCVTIICIRTITRKFITFESF
jgi:hypothetical protein